MACLKTEHPRDSLISMLLRRKFLASLGVAAMSAVPPVLAAARPRRIIGFFNVPIQTRSELTAAFKAGLREFGLVPGANIELDFRTTDSKAQLLDTVAEEIVSENPDVVVTWGLPPVLAI